VTSFNSRRHMMADGQSSPLPSHLTTDSVRSVYSSIITGNYRSTSKWSRNLKTNLCPDREIWNPDLSFSNHFQKSDNFYINTIQYWAFLSRFNKNESCTRARYATFLVIVPGE